MGIAVFVGGVLRKVIIFVLALIRFYVIAVLQQDWMICKNILGLSVS